MLEPFVERLGKASGSHIMENYRKWLRRSLVMEVAYVEVERDDLGQCVKSLEEDGIQI